MFTIVLSAFGIVPILGQEKNSSVSELTANYNYIYSKLALDKEDDVKIPFSLTEQLLHLGLLTL